VTRRPGACAHPRASAARRTAAS